MEVVYRCHGGFKNRGLRARPLTENECVCGGGGAFKTGPHVKKGFGSCTGRKSGVFRSCQDQKCGSFPVEHTRTVPI